MPTVRWLFVLLIVAPLIELYLLLTVGSFIGFWPTLAIVIVAGALGAALAKHEGLRVLRSYQDAIARGQLPDEGILGGLLVLVGGLLLVLPGPLSDVAGVLLLIPVTRRWLAGYITRMIEARLERDAADVVRVVSIGHPFGVPRAPGDELFGVRYDDGPEIVETEGVEVQSVHLLEAHHPER